MSAGNGGVMIMVSVAGMPVRGLAGKDQPDDAAPVVGVDDGQG